MPFFFLYQLKTHWKRPWCWERLRAGGEGDDRGWDGWMASSTGWTWVWVSSGSWWWTGKPGVLLSIGSQRVGHDWTTELSWTEHIFLIMAFVLEDFSNNNPTWTIDYYIWPWSWHSAYYLAIKSFSLS